MAKYLDGDGLGRAWDDAKRWTGYDADRYQTSICDAIDAVSLPFCYALRCSLVAEIAIPAGNYAQGMDVDADGLLNVFTTSLSGLGNTSKVLKVNLSDYKVVSTTDLGSAVHGNSLNYIDGLHLVAYATNIYAYDDDWRLVNTVPTGGGISQIVKVGDHLIVNLAASNNYVLYEGVNRQYVPYATFRLPISWSYKPNQDACDGVDDTLLSLTGATLANGVISNIISQISVNGKLCAVYTLPDILDEVQGIIINNNSLYIITYNGKLYKAEHMPYTVYNYTTGTTAGGLIPCYYSGSSLGTDYPDVMHLVSVPLGSRTLRVYRKQYLPRVIDGAMWTIMHTGQVIPGVGTRSDAIRASGHNSDGLFFAVEYSYSDDAYNLSRYVRGDVSISGIASMTDIEMVQAFQDSGLSIAANADLMILGTSYGHKPAMRIVSW